MRMPTAAARSTMTAWAAAVAAAVALGGCGSTEPAARPAEQASAHPSHSTQSGPTGQPRALAEPTGLGAVAPDPDRVTAVYAAVLRHHLTAVTEPLPPTVYVLQRALPRAADASRPLEGADTDGVEIEDRVRDAVARQLADLTTVRFVPSTRFVTTAADGCVTVNDRGAVITLAPVPAAGHELQIGLADFRGCLDGRWQTYVVVHAGDAWEVQGTTGSVVIS